MRKAPSTPNRSFARRVGLFVCAASIIGTLTGVMRQSWTGANVLESEACAQSRFAKPTAGCTTDPTTGLISCPTFKCRLSDGSRCGSCCNNTLTEQIFCSPYSNGVCCSPPAFNSYPCKHGQRCAPNGNGCQ